MDDLSGHIIRGYELRELIGKGAFGAVYRAYQPIVAREVAIKVILPIYANDPEFIRRFEAEAHLVARLEHPYIVNLFDYWREPDGAYMVMQLMRGGSLRTRLKKEKLALETVVLFIEQIASALAVSHRSEIVHRDVKPDNVFLDENNNTFLGDFGIAKPSGSQENTSSFSGSPGYIAPEQIRGEPATAQTDIYSLGIMLYEMLAGHHPFPTSTLSELILQQLHDPLPNIHHVRSDTPADLNLIIQKATHKNLKERYVDVLMLATDLRKSFLGNFGIQPAIDLNSITNPYKGLRSFTEADMADFYGRDALVGQLIARMAETGEKSRFLAVVGPSGSGKSSVIDAGLIPALRQNAIPDSENWFIVNMVPGNDPFRRLEAGLLSVATRPPTHLLEQLMSNSRGLLWVAETMLANISGDLLLVIDQFEEVFTILEDEVLQAHFLSVLANAVNDDNSRVRVIVSLRADFYGHPLRYEEFGALMQERTQVVLPLSPDELEDAISGPARRVGLQVDTSLITAISADVRKEPGALPLLQYALTEIFENRKGNKLTLAAFEATGGVLGALSRRSEEVYLALSDEEQIIARQLFLRLVTLGEGAEDTSRRAHRSELAELGEHRSVNTVIEAFGKYRLLTFDREMDTREPTVEIAHEALLGQWKRLCDWLDVSREDIQLERWLTTATFEWAKARYDKSYLITGARLEQFAIWSTTTDLTLTSDEREYLTASLAEWRREQEAQQEQQQREIELARQAAETAQSAEMQQRRAANRLRVVVGMLLLATIGMLVLSVIAQRNFTESQSVALAFRAQTEFVRGRNDLALALALHAAEQQGLPSVPTVVQSILGEAAYAPGTRHQFIGHTSPIMAMALSQDGRYLLSGSGGLGNTPLLNDDDSLRLWDAQSGELLKQFLGHTDTVLSVDFSPDGTLALSGSEDQTIRLWDKATGTEIHRFVGHTGFVQSVSFSPDGQTFLSGSRDKTMRLWDVKTGQEICRFRGHDSEVWSVAFSPDGRQALSGSGALRFGSGDNTLRLWDIETCEIIRNFHGHTDIVQDVTFSPDGRTALSASADLTLRLWDIETGNEIRVFTGGHTDWINKVAFSADGQFALSGSWDSRVIVWNVATGEEIRRLWGHTAIIQGVAFSPDGRTAFSASQDKTLRSWDLENGLLIRHFGIGGDYSARKVTFSPDNRFAAIPLDNYDVKMIDINTGEEVQVFRGHHDMVNSIAFSPDNRLLLTAGADQFIILWDIETGLAIRRFEGSTGRIWDLDVSPDGRIAVSGSDDSTVRVWDIATGRQLNRFQGTSEVYAVAFAYNGQSVLAGMLDNSLVLWDIASGQEIHHMGDRHTSAIWVLSVSSDGHRAITGSYDNRLILWDLDIGTEIRRFEGHSSTVMSADFDPTGRYIISGSYDNTVRIWDAETGEELARTNYGVPLVSMDINSSNQTVLLDVGKDTLLARLPPIELDEMLIWITEHRYIYEFSCTERLKYDISPC